MKDHLSMDVNFLGPLDFSPQVFHSSHISVTLVVWSKGQNYRKDWEPIIKKSISSEMEKRLVVMGGFFSGCLTALCKLQMLQNWLLK